MLANMVLGIFKALALIAILICKSVSIVLQHLLWEENMTDVHVQFALRQQSHPLPVSPTLQAFLKEHALQTVQFPFNLGDGGHGRHSLRKQP